MTPTLHDAGRVALGSVGSNDRTITCESGNPETFKAGLVVRRSSSGGLQLADDSTATRIGVSLGKPLVGAADNKKTSVCRAGNYVPVLLKDEGVKSSLTIQTYLKVTAVEKGEAGDDITIELVEGTPGDVTVEGLAISVEIEAGTTTVAEIVDAINEDVEASVLVTAEVLSGGDTETPTAAAAANLDNGADSYPYVVKGQTVKTDDVTGEASSDGDASNAFYESEPLIGVYPDGTEAWVALIDMGDGL